MANFNQVILMGYLTRDPALTYLPNQTAVAEFGLAVNRTWTKADGSKATEACFVDCQIFAKRAEALAKYFHKGDPIFVLGHLKFEQWKGKTDHKSHSRLRVLVESFEFVAKSSNNSGNNRSGEQDL